MEEGEEEQRRGGGDTGCYRCAKGPGQGEHGKRPGNTGREEGRASCTHAEPGAAAATLLHRLVGGASHKARGGGYCALGTVSCISMEALASSCCLYTECVLNEVTAATSAVVPGLCAYPPGQRSSTSRRHHGCGVPGARSTCRDACGVTAAGASKMHGLHGQCPQHTPSSGVGRGA